MSADVDVMKYEPCQEVFALLSVYDPVLRGKVLSCAKREVHVAALLSS